MPPVVVVLKVLGCLGPVPGDQGQVDLELSTSSEYMKDRLAFVYW